MSPTATGSPETPVGSRFRVWLAGAAGSLLGDAALHFALGWAASGLGGAAAGLVLTAVVLPRVGLLLLGGAFADRYGARRVVVVGDAVMVLGCVVAAMASRYVGTPLWLLVLIALLIGTVSAFYLPASASMPRLLVPETAVPRALALRQTVGNAVVLVGPPAGGALVVAGGLPASLAFSSATFLIMLLILVLLVPLPRDESRARPGHLLREIAGGTAVAARDPILRSAFVVIGGAAAFLLPTTSLMVPLLARADGWSAATTGLVVGVFGGASAAVALVVATRGPFDGAGVASAVGLLVAGAGTALLASGGPIWVVLLGGAVTGGGSGAFATHVGAVVLRAAPEQYLSRIQSINILVQSLPLLLTNTGRGALADLVGARPVTLAGAGLTVAIGVFACLDRPFRSASLGRR